MARYIDVDEMKKQLCEDCGILYETDVEKCDKNCLLMDTVDCMETLDVQPVVHAKWIDNGISESILYACSNCGFPSGAYSFNYCPKCGSKMRRIYE